MITNLRSTCIKRGGGTLTILIVCYSYTSKVMFLAGYLLKNEIITIRNGLVFNCCPPLTLAPHSHLALILFSLFFFLLFLTWHKDVSGLFPITGGVTLFCLVPIGNRTLPEIQSNVWRQSETLVLFIWGYFRRLDKCIYFVYLFSLDPEQLVHFILIDFSTISHCRRCVF